MQTAVAFKPLQKAAGARSNGVTRRTRVLVHAKHGAAEKVPLQTRVVPALMAVVITASGGTALVDALYPAVARADVMIDEDANLSPYERRQREMERRRQLLREAREKAEARSTGEAAPQTAPAPAEEPSSSMKGAAERLKKTAEQTYEKAAAKSLSAPAAAPEAAEPVNPFSGFSFPKVSAPAPEAPSPAPTPAPAKPSSSSSSSTGDIFKDLAKYTEAPVKPAAPAKPSPPPQAAKPAAKPAPAKPAPAKPSKPGKRRGPLPLWFTELLVLGSFVGLGAAATKYQKESGAVLKVVGGKVVEAYQALEKLTSKQSA